MLSLLSVLINCLTNSRVAGDFSPHAWRSCNESQIQYPAGSPDLRPSTTAWIQNWSSPFRDVDMSLFPHTQCIPAKVDMIPGFAATWPLSHKPRNTSYNKRVLWLTHWGQDKMAAISQKTFSNALPRMRTFEFCIKFHWIMFLGVSLTIWQQLFR